MLSDARVLVGRFFRKYPLPKVRSTESGKLGFLESVRGLAAGAVVLVHILAAFYPGSIIGPSKAPANNELVGSLFYGLPLGFSVAGYFAVMVFFVLSGFVLTYRFFQSHDQNDIYKQAAKRYFRLAIPVFCAVSVAYLLFANGVMLNDSVAELTGSIDASSIYNFTPNLMDAVYNATIGVLVDGNTKYNPVLWTMSIELLGSFIVLGMALIISGLKKRWLMYTGAVILSSHSYYVCFILGMLLADIASNTNIITYLRQKVSGVYAYILLLAALVLASFPNNPTGDIDGTFFKTLLIPGLDPFYIHHIWLVVAAFSLLLVILVRLEIQKLLSNQLLVFLGGISFAVYLTHYLVLYCVGGRIFSSMRDDFGFDVSALTAGLVTVLVTLVVSILWKKYIDDMSVRVSRRFAGYILKQSVSDKIE